MSQTVLPRRATTDDEPAPTTRASRTSRPRRTPSGVLALTASAVGLAVATRIGAQDLDEIDLWWQLRTGQHVLATRQLTWVDPSAPRADHPYVATQWLPEVVAYLTHDRFGLLGVVGLRTLGVLALLVATYAAARMAAGRLTAVLTATLAVAGASGSLGPRPQVISFILFALVVAACWRMARDHRPRWWLVPVFWLWGCCHGLWAFGLLLLGALVLALVLDPSTVLRPGQRRRLAALVAACAGILCLTPLGPGLLLSPFTVASIAAQVAQEWGPTPLYNVYALLTAVVVVAVAVLWARRPAARPWWQLAMLAMAAACTLWMWRLVPLGGILVAPLLAAELQTRMNLRREVFTGREAVTAIGLGLTSAAVGLLLVGSPVSRAPGDTRSVDAALDAAPAGSVVYPDFGVSGWLLWRHPDLSPVIDLRGEIYDAGDFADFNRVDRVERGWQQTLAESGARYAVQPPDSALATALVDRLGWTVTARSPGFVLLQAPED